jgi:hypothetical protein
MRLSLMALGPLLAGPLLACNRGDLVVARTAHAQAIMPRTGGAAVLGTIHATLDGAKRTWYVVAGDVHGKPYSSAMWFETRRARLISIGGFDTDHPPIESFTFDVAAGDVSFGSYEGSTVQVLVSVADSERTARVNLPADRGRQFTVGYMPKAGGDMLSGTYTMTAGSITVSEVRFDGGRASVRGTFRGTLEKVDGSARVQVEDGEFEASGIPSRDQLAGR